MVVGWFGVWCGVFLVCGLVMMVRAFGFILDLLQVFCWFVVFLFCGVAKCFWHFELFWCLFDISGFW